MIAFYLKLQKKDKRLKVLKLIAIAVAIIIDLEPFDKKLEWAL